MNRLTVALALVRCTAALLPDPEQRARHLEQWRADVRGAAELDLSPLRIAAGTAVAAALMTVTTRKETPVLPIGPLALALRLVGGRTARRRAVTLAALSGMALLSGLGLLLAQ
ncbi:hypothetical protein ACFOOK_07160 [Micromonospora krabiensis]|uniref:Uncharacterized protein n=1 Tax=Micromonospora krabiensis TaxID=307121 RepID=A0A1C3NCB3_9ACTN|nr:hypothetical protein [Micromonospora krabiensis]SBV30225.1 hypothetical protein GA0070620_5818 [Micromonospora krabiensis]